MSGITFINNAVNYVALAGQEEWTSSSGTFTWIVPRGVFEIHVVCIGGGGGGAAHASSPAAGGNGGSLSWSNKIAVKPGESLTVTVGAGGSNGTLTGTVGGNGGQSSIFRGATNLISAAGGQGGNFGGSASTSPTTALINGTNNCLTGSQAEGSYSFGGTSFVTTAASSERCSGGGGAAGYAANQNLDTMTGGVGGTNTTGYTAGTLGGGGGGSGGITSNNGGAGGGTGPWGQGTSGSAAAATGGSCGAGGSDGLPITSFMSPQAQCLASSWSAAGFSQNGGLFGGGGGGGLNSNPGTGSGFGARGCVRIIWGEGRGYPSTNTGNYYGSDAVTNSQQNYFTPGAYAWIVPAGVTEFSVCAIGGGGAGMQGSSTTGKGSGAGGGLAWGNFNCKPGEQFNIVVGAAGNSNALNSAQAGGNSTVVRNASFEGFISGTNLYVTRVRSGIITIGMNVSSATPFTITGFQTGELGNEGTYTISVSQTLGSLNTSGDQVFGGNLTLLTAGGGEGARAVSGGLSVGGTFSVHSSAKSSGGALGGAGGASSSSTTAQGGSGGGAAGYQGTAGGAGRSAGTIQNGNYPTPYVANRYSLTGGSSSGRTGGSALTMGAGGGGTGIYGTGKDANMDTGQVSSALTGAGIGGSGGTNGAAPAGTGQGGEFGGGGGGAGNNFTSGRSNGGIGGVRITWGARHKYPAPTTDV
jgi:hypothetical protein